MAIAKILVTDDKINTSLPSYGHGNKALVPAKITMLRVNLVEGTEAVCYVLIVKSPCRIQTTGIIGSRSLA